MVSLLGGQHLYPRRLLALTITWLQVGRMVQRIVLELVTVCPLDKLWLRDPHLLVDLVTHVWLWPKLVLTVITQVLVDSLRRLILGQVFERSGEVDLALEELVTSYLMGRLEVLRLQLVHVHLLVHHLRNLLIIEGLVLLGQVVCLGRTVLLPDVHLVGMLQLVMVLKLRVVHY